MTAPALQAEKSTVLAHLEHITRRWNELDFAPLLEIVHLTSEDQARVYHVAHYRLDQIEEAATDICGFNKSKMNSYAAPNPVREDKRPAPNKRAKADDIGASFFHWADADDETGAENIRSFVGPACTFFVITGTQPCTRLHVYWELEEPTYNLDAWSRTQRAIATTLKTDPAVVDPPRIMRIAGTVNWPKPKKIANGYAAEVTALKIHDEDDRPPVTSERMARAFTGAQSAADCPVKIDTGTHDRKSADDYSDALRRARTDGEKHTGVRDLSASLAGAGVPQAMAEAIIRNACPVWDENVDDLIRSAYDKFYQPEPETFRPSPEAVNKDESGVITGLRILSSEDFLSDLTPAVYVVDGVLAKRRCLSLTGYAGHGKTTLALHLAIQVATGGTFGGMDCEQGSVLILAGENADNVKWQYAAACAAAGVEGGLPINFLPGHFQLSEYLDDLLAKAQQIPNLQLVIIDSLQAFFEGENDNGNVEMMEAARRFRALSEIESGPSVVVIAHPAGKRPDKSNIVPRGGSAFGNEFDGNLTVWAEPDGTQTFHHSEKFRGAPFDPLPFVMEDREFDHLKDHKGRNLRLKVSRMQMLIEQANAAQKSERRDQEAITIIDGNPRITQRALAEALGVSKTTADRVMQTLRDEKLIKRHARKWVLTDGGKEFLNGD